VLIVLKCGSLSLMEPSGPIAGTEIAYREVFCRIQEYVYLKYAVRQIEPSW